MILEEIFEIVSKMNPKEKSYFLRFAKLYSPNSKDRNYLSLYNKVNEQIKKKKVNLDSVSSGIPVSKFYNYKQHLHKALLKSLNSYYSLKNKEKKLVYGIDTVKWLMKRGIVSTAKRLLKKLKKESLKTEAFETLLAIHTLEIGMLQYEDLKDQLKTIQVDIEWVMDKYKVYTEYLSLFKQVMHLRRKEAFLPDDDESLNYYHNHPLLEKEETANSNKSKFLLFSIKSTIAYIKRDYLESFINNKKLAEILKADGFKSVPSFDILHNVMLTAIHTANREAFWTYYEHLKALCEQSKNEYTHNLLRKVTLKYHQVFEEYDEGIDLIKKSKIIDKDPAELIEIESSFLIEIYFFFVSAGKFEEAMTFLNHWYESIGPKITPKYKIVARAIEVLIHLELKNYLLAHNLVDSLLQHFLLKKTYHVFEKTIINYCRNSLKYPNNSTKLQQIQKETIEAINSLDKTKDNVFWFEYFDFQAYFRQKLERL